MAIQFGKTWWGEHWLRSLENVDYDNRLPRGATYARKGNVLSVRTKDNEMKARVSGSRATPYKVTIIVPPFFEDQIERLIDRIVMQPALISKLLNRELDPSILQIAEEVGLKVFPKQWTDFKMQCSCPDWAVPCKHLAAVIYMISREIDNNPFLVFEMHKVDLLDELKKRGLFIKEQKKNGVPRLNSLWRREKRKGKSGFEEERAYERVDFSELRDVGEPLVQLLADAPPFYPGGNFKDIYASQFIRLGKEAKRLLNKRLDFEALFPVPADTLAISHHTRLSFTVDRNNRVVVLANEGTGGLMKNGEKTTGDGDGAESGDGTGRGTGDGIGSEAGGGTGSEAGDGTGGGTGSGSTEKELQHLLPELFKLNPDYLPDYQPSVAASHRMLFAAIHLTANGNIVPQIVELENRRSMVRWIPAMMDEQTRVLVGKLAEIVPPGLLQTSYKSRQVEKWRPVENQTEELLSLFISALVTKMSKPSKEDLFEDLFFKGKSHDFSDVGEKGLDGGIKVWLDRYYLTAEEYKPLITVNEINDGMLDDQFEVAVSIQDRSLSDVAPYPLSAVLKEKEFEQQRFKILQNVSLLSPFIRGLDIHINTAGDHLSVFETAEFAPFLMEILPAIRLLGIPILLPKSLQELLRPKVSMLLQRKSEQGGFVSLDDLLTFDWRVALGDTLLSQEEFNKLMANASGLFRFKEQYIYVNEEEIEKLHKIFTQEKPLSPYQLFQTALSEEYEGTPVSLTDEVRAMMAELTSVENIPLPRELKATMRPYQERGYSWMYRNSRIGFGSIIADDMGLGKTVQVIAILLKLKEEQAINEKQKALVVVPTGLLTNWQAEIAKFSPSLSTHIYHGTARDLKQFDADIMLTTYGVARGDSEILKKQKWQVMVIDEAQNIKNHEAGQSKAIKTIPANIRIAMSGTPVENRLSEFWSIMDFTNKGYLGTVKAFKNDYATPIQLFNDEKVVKKFRKITSPFMMRRMKTDKTIISDLPDKVEQNQFAVLSKQQAALYEKTMEAAMEEIEGYSDNGDNQTLFKRQGLVLQMILALKQICNHPAHFLKNGNWDPALSGKVELLFELLDSIISTGEKVLIFTQFREMGSILEKIIAERFGDRPMFYHGGCTVPERQKMVERFQTDRADKVFILSLKAAGTGLNLTAASHVIHFDLWWNPAVENQATDRAYRIGQKKNVMVHRMITKNTFEEKIDEMIQRKKHLADMTVATGESWIGKLSNKELREIFE